MTLPPATLAAFLAPAIILVTLSILIGQQIVILRRRSSLPEEWAPELSVDRYRPMFRLLDDEDLRFLRSQPGATPFLVERLRRQRCQVFRGYLRCLEHDYQMASKALMLVTIQSQLDRRDNIRALIDRRMKFAIGIFRVRCRLFLYRWNVGRESVASLVGLFEGLQLELLALVPDMDRAGA